MRLSGGGNSYLGVIGIGGGGGEGGVICVDRLYTGSGSSYWCRRSKDAHASTKALPIKNSHREKPTKAALINNAKGQKPTRPFRREIDRNNQPYSGCCGIQEEAFDCLTQPVNCHCPRVVLSFLTYLLFPSCRHGPEGGICRR